MWKRSELLPESTDYFSIGVDLPAKYKGFETQNTKPLKHGGKE
jgi:hypothetical protein